MAYYLERVDLRQGGRLPLSTGAVSIGRSPGNTVALAAGDRCVSAYHAVIYADPRRMLLQDLQSTNGTFVNGRRVTECVLSAGDEIGLGRSGPKFRIVGDGGVDVDSVNNDGCTEVPGLAGDSLIYTDSIDAALTGITAPPPLPDGDEGRNRPQRRSRAVTIAVLAASAAALISAALLASISILSSITAPLPKKTAAGKVFFSSEPESSPAPAENGLTPFTPATTLPTPAPAATTRDRINTVLARFGEDGYRAPTEMVERVEHYLELYRGAMRGAVTLWMERSTRYFPMIRAVFSEKNVPLELAYVSMLESGLNTQAVSRAGAAGMWQFMPGTARRYGLRVGGGIDERADPEKATRAAAAYFKDLIAIFGSRSSVLLCMAAYNAGEQRVINALKRIDDPVRDRDFWYLYRMGWLAQETNEYIPQIIALIIISDTPEEYGFKGGNL
jgi:hypothetical protein